MASRRQRKRHRRQVHPEGPATADRRGDRDDSPVGGRGEPIGLWATASRGDLRLLRRAIREGWDVPEARRATLLHEVCQQFEASNPRLTIAIAWVLIEADKFNLRTELVERMARQITDAD